MTDTLKHKKTFINVLGVVYVHTKTSDGGDLYLTRFAAQYRKHFEIGNWYEPDWFNKHKTRLDGTGSVYRVPTKEVDGKALDLVVKNCRVGEDVPLDTHTLQEFCGTEFNSPWEEFSLVMEIQEGHYGPKNLSIKTQLPMVIYVPPEKMQLWQSGRSRAKINRIRAKHPGIDLDILKQYKLIYAWVEGLSLPEAFAHIKIEDDERIRHLKTLDKSVMSDMEKKGYLVADMKPAHIIITENAMKQIQELGKAQGIDAVKEEISYIYNLIGKGEYSVVDYELLLRTPEHERAVKDDRRHTYLDYQRDRFVPAPLPNHLRNMEIFGVPYIFGHAESTGGRLWVVGKNARLFDYFLPERWRKTPSIKLSDTKEIFYTVTKDNIHLVWETSSVGELPHEDEEDAGQIRKFGINSPFEEFAIAHKLSQFGIPCAYVRAIYMTGSPKIEASADLRRYESHKNILDPEGEPILQENYNYITIRGYYNGPDHWVAAQRGPLYVPLNLTRAFDKGLIDDSQRVMLLNKTKENLKNAGYDGGLLKPGDLLLSVDSSGKIVNDNTGSPLVVICNFQHIWGLSDALH